MQEYTANVGTVESSRHTLEKARKAALKGETSLATVVALKKKLDLEGNNVIHLVNDEASGTDMPSAVFLMAAGKERDGGLDLLKRMHPHRNGDLDRAWVHVDVVARHVNGWKTIGAHVYSPEASATLTIALMYIKNETGVVVGFFWGTLVKVAKRHGFRGDVEFWGIMQDGAGALWNGFVEVWPLHPEERKGHCQLHFGQNVEAVSVRCLPICLRSENNSLLYLWQQSPTDEDRLENRRKLFEFWVTKCKATSLPELMSFFSWHEKRQKFIVDMYNPSPADLPELLNRPNSSLAETMHAKMKRSGGYNLTVVKAVTHDVTTLARQVALALTRSTGSGGFGSGPRLRDLEERCGLNTSD